MEMVNMKNAPPEHEAQGSGDGINANNTLKHRHSTFSRKNKGDASQRKSVGFNTMADSKQRSSGCKSCFSGLCLTKTLVSKYDREEYIRTILCELAVYTLYLTITCMITYGLTTQNSYYYTHVVADLFVDSQFGDDETTFKTSTTVNDFWEFAETTMLDGLYWKYWYGIEDNSYAIAEDQRAVLYENKLIGRARLRQLRVIEEPCPVSEKLQAKLFRICYPRYHRSLEDKGAFDSILGNQDAWKYHSEKELGGTSYWGQLTTYSGAGAFQLLGTDKDETLQLIIQLKNSLWITRATRAIFLDFTLHNANVNLFCIVTLAWEFPTTGGLIPSWSIRTIKISRYDTPYEYFLLGLEFLFIGFTVYYTFQEIFEIFTVKCKYWSDVNSYLDISILTLSYLCIGFSVYKYYLLENYLEELLKDTDKHANFYWFGFWENQYTNTVAVLVFLTWIKLFKYISFNRTMTQLATTMSRCAKDVGGFAVMFFIIFFAFAQLGYLLFGSTVEDFRTFYDTTFALLRLILGDFDFRAIEAANRLLGPAYFITYVFFVFFVLLNMFLAIINDTYSEVKAEIKGHGAEFEVTDYVKRSLNRYFGGRGWCMSAKLDLEGQVRLANTENIITNSELRENFKKASFNDVEIEMFLTKYELDEERRIDLDEAENVLGGLEGFHNPDGKADSDDTKIKRPSTGENPLTDQEISELQSRMSILESSLTNVTRRMDHLMEKLENVSIKLKRPSLPPPEPPF